MNTAEKPRPAIFVVGDIAGALLVAFTLYVIGSDVGVVDWLLDTVARGAGVIGYLAAFIYEYWIPVSIGLAVAGVLAMLDRRRVPVDK